MIQKFPSTDTVPFDVIEWWTCICLVICFATNKICYSTKNFISNEVVNIFVELLIPKAIPITVGIVYKPPDQTWFLEILSNILNSLNMLSEECHILGDLNINLYHNGSTLGEDNK